MAARAFEFPSCTPVPRTYRDPIRPHAAACCVAAVQNSRMDCHHLGGEKKPMSNVARMIPIDVAEQDKRHHLHPYTNPVALSKNGPDVIVRAEGIYLYTSEGRRIMDIGSALHNVNIGYGNRRLCQAAFDVMQQLSFSQTVVGRSNPWTAMLSAKLAEITPNSFQHFLFASTGSEAIECALKLALRYWRLRGQPKKRAIISRRLSFHGNTLFTASLTGIEAYHTQFGLPFTDQIHYADAPYYYRDGKGRSKEQFGLDVAQALEEQILKIGPENIAALVGEPIQVAGGTIIPPSTYWPEVRRICTKYDILLIVDEIITGFGKTGQMFGFQSFDFEPDLFAMAKGLSSGYFPISAVGVGAKVSDVLQSADEVFAHVFTNSGHPVGAAVALENLAVIEEQGLVEKVRTEIGPHFAQRLQELVEFPCVGEVRSMGVLGVIEFDLSKGGNPASKEQQTALLAKMGTITWRRGLANRGNGMCLPMTITKEQIDEAIGILKESITEALS